MGKKRGFFAELRGESGKTPRNGYGDGKCEKRGKRGEHSPRRGGFRR